MRDQSKARKTYEQFERSLYELDPLDALELVHDIEVGLTDLMSVLATCARGDEYTWEQIGDAIETTRQGAWNRLH